MRRLNLKNIYVLYTISFLLLCSVIFSPFLVQGKSFVWHLDGLDQHYPSLLYCGKLLRGLLSGKGFPMVDFKIGMGFDTLTTLNYYALGDPIALLTVFMIPKNSIFFYDLLILVRFYLTGISFIIFMRYYKKDETVISGIVLGALIYVFSGYALFAGVRHPFFMNPMIYLPLLMIGAEEVLRRKKPYLMIIMVFISAVSNFYFLYDLTVILIAYIIFRYFTLYRKQYKNILLGLLLTGLRTGGYYLLGIACASFIFIPILYAFSRNGRLSTSPLMPHGFLYYDAQYYLSLFQGVFAGSTYHKYWSLLSFSPIMAVSLAIMSGSKKYRRLQIVYLLALVGLLIPAFGYFMNGFSYTANRWSFAISLLFAGTFAFTYQSLLELNKNEKIILLAEVVLYGVLTLAFPSETLIRYMFFALLFVAITILALQMKRLQTFKQINGIIVYLLVLLSLGLNGYGVYAKQFNNYAKEFLSKSEVKKLTTMGELSLIPKFTDKTFYRVETYGEKAINESMIVGYRDVAGYFSLMDAEITDYLMQSEVLSQKTAIRFENLDNRSALDELASVKYFVTTDPTAVPYGYKFLNESEKEQEKYYLYENTYALPLGYTYHSYMLRENFDKLNSLEKQKAMLGTVILDQNTDYAASASPNSNADINKLNVEIIPGEGVTFLNNTIEVTNPGATITLKFADVPDSETYVRFHKLQISGKLNEMVNFDVKGLHGANKQVNVRSAYYSSYFGKENYLVNLGYSISGESEATITFPKAVTFSCDEIEVYSVGMGDYVDKVNALQASSLMNIKKSNNRIQGDISLDQKGILLLGIPYSKGWSAYVDGTKAMLLPANVMYMALPLEAGKHSILLKYRTPYLQEGFAVSIAAFLVFIGIMNMDKIIKKKRTQKIGSE